MAYKVQGMRLVALGIVMTVVAAHPSAAWGQGRAAAAREVAEYIMRRFGSKAVPEGVEGLAPRLARLAERHGDDALVAARKVGPSVFRYVEEAGEHGAAAIKLMARHGDDAVWIVAKQNRLAFFVQYGDDAAGAMMKHQSIVIPVIEANGAAAAKALNAVSGPNARRLAMLHNSGELQKIGRTQELLGVIGKYGDRAAEFVWKHKGALMVTAALVAFLSDPEPFLNGVKDITQIVGETAIKPITTGVGEGISKVPDVAGQAAVEAARTVNWTLVIICALVLVGVLVGMRQLHKAGRIRRREAAKADPAHKA